MKVSTTASAAGGLFLLVSPFGSDDHAVRGQHQDIPTPTGASGGSNSSSAPSAPGEDDYAGPASKSCVAEALEERVRDPRRLVFGDIDMVVGFATVPESAEVEFTLLVPTHGWVGFGVSEVGSMAGADIVVVEPPDGEGRVGFEITDRYSKGFVEPAVDKVQNWELLDALHETLTIEGCDGGGHEPEVSLTTVVVRRMMDTCDGEDEKLTPDFLQNYFIAAYGEDDQKSLSYHPKRASALAYVHVPEPMIPKSPKGAALDILTPHMTVPAGVTHYCSSTVTIDRPLMVTGFRAPHSSHSDKVHHVSLIKPDNDPRIEGGYVCEPSSTLMGTVILPLGIGTSDIVLPSGIYIRIDPGEYFIETHFENLSGDGFEITTGFRAHVVEDETQVNPQDEMQIIKVEGRFANDPIPPGLERAERGYELAPECLEGLPPTGVTVMATAAHTHRWGVAIQAYRARGGRNDLVFEQRAFDFNKQNPIWRPWSLLPGDRFHWRCAWDTTGAPGAVPWGLTADEEMCQVYLAASNWGSLFRYAGMGLTPDGSEDTFAYCGPSRPLDFRVGEVREWLANPPVGAVVAETDPAPPAWAFVEAGRDRNNCQALALAEISAPANNWLWGSPLFYILVSWILQASFQRVITWWCLVRNEIRKDEPWFACRSLNAMEAVMCWTVLVLVLFQFGLHFKIETDEVYDLAGEEPLGQRLEALSSAGDYIAAVYVIVFVVKATHRRAFYLDFAHHGTALATIWLLRNAIEYEYAPSFLCFFAACMILHSGASAPMYTSFLLLKLNPNPSKYGRRLAVVFMASSAAKQGIMIAAHVANFWNYRLFFDEETFRLRDVSTSQWNDRPYFETRKTARDLWMQVPWMEILKICLPIFWVILIFSQLYNSWLHYQIGMFEYCKKYDDSGNVVAEKKVESFSSEEVVDSSSGEEVVEPVEMAVQFTPGDMTRSGSSGLSNRIASAQSIA